MTRLWATASDLSRLLHCLFRLDPSSLPSKKKNTLRLHTDRWPERASMRKHLPEVQHLLFPGPLPQTISIDYLIAGVTSGL